MRYSFPKSERLYKQTPIDQLYSEGHKFLVFPFSVHWLEYPEAAQPVQVLIVCSKRKFRHAVDRNKVKRAVRECYRLHKPQLYSFLGEKGLHILLSISYISSAHLDYHHLTVKYEKMLDTLQKEIAKTL